MINTSIVRWHRPLGWLAAAVALAGSAVVIWNLGIAASATSPQWDPAAGSYFYPRGGPADVILILTPVACLVLSLLAVLALVRAARSTRAR